MRARSPPIDVCTTSRSVCATNVGVRSTESRGGRGGPADELAVQVATHCDDAGAGAGFGCLVQPATVRATAKSRASRRMAILSVGRGQERSWPHLTARRMTNARRALEQALPYTG